MTGLFSLRLLLNKKMYSKLNSRYEKQILDVSSHTETSTSRSQRGHWPYSNARGE